MQDAVAGAALQRMQGNKFGRKGSGELARIKTSGPLTRARHRFSYGLKLIALFPSLSLFLRVARPFSARPLFLLELSTGETTPG